MDLCKFFKMRSYENDRLTPLECALTKKGGGGSCPFPMLSPLTIGGFPQTGDSDRVGTEEVHVLERVVPRAIDLDHRVIGPIHVGKEGTTGWRVEHHDHLAEEAAGG